VAPPKPRKRVTDRTGCVIVHHKSLDTIFRTVELILENGIAASNVVVVDNSEDPEVAKSLRTHLFAGVRLLLTKNGGYAAAVNTGVDFLTNDSDPDFILVSTHEVQPRHDAVGAMLNAMASDESIAVAGPTLASSGDPYAVSAPVWSTGGTLTRWLSLPAHTGSGRPLATVLQESSGLAEWHERQWLDGAFCLYRAAVLAERLREDFFLYSEELEFHTRLRALGHKVVWAPRSVATQQTKGTPPYYQARNLQIFLRLRGNGAQMVVSVPILIVRERLVRILRRRRTERGALRRSLRGLRDGWTHEIRNR
jgi:N-acetylglucosaminyl-diphospho-decaprenol L-rhamnosyltransferase